MEPAMTAPRIASPCHESWDAMAPSAGGRHCASCDKTVVDVSAMAPAAAHLFLDRELPARLGRGERVCVRAHADRSGRLLRPGVRRRLLTNGLAGMLALAGLAGLGGGLQAAEDASAPVGQTAPRMVGEATVRVGDVATPQPMMGAPSLPSTVTATATDGATALRIDVLDNGTVRATAADGRERWSASLPGLGAAPAVAAIAFPGDGSVRLEAPDRTAIHLDLATGHRAHAR
jgi:hypothetical protein